MTCSVPTLKVNSTLTQMRKNEGVLPFRFEVRPTSTLSTMTVLCVQFKSIYIFLEERNQRIFSRSPSMSPETTSFVMLCTYHTYIYHPKYTQCFNFLFFQQPSFLPRTFPHLFIRFDQEKKSAFSFLLFHRHDRDD